ncbi:hypothetical protein H6501_02590 [Candidatus Woesearchaeota archaeon]|nr:hypothetical protein [Nanoarchaeota archaeon]MCB9370459.1 hypothetical protein [Candidatus Woesearchaeota archaeon]USN43537.1 MAG: hypothetical protein H6500_04030 [Candidatus Woesearchaeota archaeon]
MEVTRKGVLPVVGMLLLLLIVSFSFLLLKMQYSDFEGTVLKETNRENARGKLEVESIKNNVLTLKNSLNVNVLVESITIDHIECLSSPENLSTLGTYYISLNGCTASLHNVTAYPVIIKTANYYSSEFEIIIT